MGRLTLSASVLPWHLTARARGRGQSRLPWLLLTCPVSSPGRGLLCVASAPAVLHSSPASSPLPRSRGTRPCSGGVAMSSKIFRRPSACHPKPAVCVLGLQCQPRQVAPPGRRLWALGARGAPAPGAGPVSAQRASFREGGRWGDGLCGPWKDGAVPGSCRVASPALRAPGSSSRQVGGAGGSSVTASNRGQLGPPAAQGNYSSPVSTRIYSQYPVRNRNGGEYKKKNVCVYKYITESLCCTAVINLVF